MNQPETDTIALPGINAAETIRSWLPDHTHVHVPGVFDTDWATTWTWTTSAGVWTMSRTRPFLGSSTLALAGPGVKVAFSGSMALSRMHAMLVVLELTPALAAADV